MRTETLNAIESYSTFNIPASFTTCLNSVLVNAKTRDRFSLEYISDLLSPDNMYSSLWALDKLRTETSRSYERLVCVGPDQIILIKWLLIHNMVLETTVTSTNDIEGLIANLVIGPKLQRFSNLTQAMYNQTTEDLVINLHEEKADSTWYDAVKPGTTCIIQTSNAKSLDNVNIVDSITELTKVYPMSGLVYAGTLVFPQHKRLMIIGIR